MTRTLPWLKKDTGSRNPTTAVRNAAPRPQKRQRLLDPDPDSDDYASHQIAADKRRLAAIAAERTPSTSPPPAPPTEEQMRPGLSQDDIYIMVEDEFHAIAQQFTKHLHHAEYVRLKNAAKTRNVSALTTITHPTDSVTALREETKKKKQAEAQEQRAKASVEAVTKKVAGAGEDSSAESDFENEERPDDPWQGTQLQYFMTKSPKKSLAGLTGLQGVVSHTRAAAGLTRPAKPIHNPTRLVQSNTIEAKTATENHAPELVSDLTAESDDDDDLDAPVRATSHALSKPPAPISSRSVAPLARKRAVSPSPRAISKSPAPISSKPVAPPPHSTNPRPHSPPLRNPLRRPLIDMSSLPPPAPKPASRIPNPASKSPESTLRKLEPRPAMQKESVEITRASGLDREVLRRRKARREREERERKGSKVVGVDEIPVFLV